jgi:hypothetical protein
LKLFEATPKLKPKTGPGLQQIRVVFFTSQLRSSGAVTLCLGPRVAGLGAVAAECGAAGISAAGCGNGMWHQKTEDFFRVDEILMGFQVI